jgi:hypothetical protein
VLATGGGARVGVQWADQAGFVVGGDARLGLQRFEAGHQRLALARGKLVVRAPHAPGRALEVATPGHLVSVRGTWFTVAAYAQETTVEVLEGVVEVADLDGSASTTLRAPARAVFGRGRASSGALGAGEAARLRARDELSLVPFVDLKSALDTTGLLRVGAEGEGTITVDGLPVGAAPLELRRARGRHLVELQRHGLAVTHKWIEVGPEPGELRLAGPPEPVAPSEPVEIGDMIRRRASQIRSCYERRLKLDHTLEGTVSLRLRVGDTGRVTQVKIEEASLPDPLVGECLRHEAQSWRFDVGRNATVVYPFVFRPE